MISESIKLADTLAGLPRALSEDEHSFYNATLRLGATMMRTCDLEARAKEILAEKQYDELRDFDGDGHSESV
jgi:hypothetical protein